MDPITGAAVLSALGTGTAATATTAATAGLFGTAGTFSFMSAASTLGTAFSAYSTIQGGRESDAAYKSQAKWNELQARQERLRGQQEANQIKGDLAKSIASANARGAASGIDITSGSPVTAVNAAIDDANDAWTIAKSNAESNAASSEANAYAARQRGKNAVRSSRSQVTGLATDFASKQYDRGMRF